MSGRVLLALSWLVACDRKPPTPEAVCDHLIELATAAKGATAARAALGTRAQCIAHVERENTTADQRASCEFNVCTMRAKTWAAADACLKQSPTERDPGSYCAPR